MVIIKRLPTMGGTQIKIKKVKKGNVIPSFKCQIKM